MQSLYLKLQSMYVPLSHSIPHVQAPLQKVRKSNARACACLCVCSINPAVDKEKSLDDAIKANVQYQVEQLKVCLCACVSMSVSRARLCVCV